MGGKAAGPASLDLGHEFTRPGLLDQALTHASSSGRQGGGRASSGDGGASNERLEFLGDRVLALIVADMLLARFPEEDEGRIAQRHSALVRREALARVAGAIDLGVHLRLSRGEAATGGRNNPALLADAMEAVIAALYQDGGLEAARRFIEAHWRGLLEETPEPPKDAKTELQEWAQARGLGLPEYREAARSGPAHAPSFTCEVSVAGYPSVAADGPSKRAAEQRAAEELLERLASER